MSMNDRTQRDPGRPLRTRASAVACSFLVVLCFLSSAFAQSWTPEGEIRSYVRTHYPWAEIDLSGLRVQNDLPAEKPTALVVEKAPPGNAVFRFDFRNGKSITAFVFVKTYDQVIMSRNSFRKGYILTRNDVYATLMDSNRIPRGALREEVRVVGKPLTRSIVANAPITDAMISETPLVKRGHKVVLSIESTGFTIRTAGETRSDAAVGELVKVENYGSKRIVTGMLIDENTVRVEY